VFKKLLVVVLTASAASTTTAAAAATPNFVGAPAAAYGGMTISFIARFDRELPHVSQAGFVVAPSLRVNQRVRNLYGGNPPGHVGVASRHCYVAEAVRLRPLAKRRAGAKWKVGMLLNNTNRVLRTRPVTLVHLSSGRGEIAWEKANMARLGCN